MSKFICSNVGDNVVKVKVHNDGFPVNAQVDTPSFSAVLFDKISQHHTDFRRYAEGGIFIVGTPILRVGVDVEDLPRYVYDCFNEDVANIGRIKKDIVGMWACFLYKGDSAWVFNDYYGLYDICYSSGEGGGYVIGNQLSDVAMCMPSLTFDEYPFMMENFQLGAFPGETMFKGIKKLKSDEVLQVSDALRIIKIQPEQITYTYKDEVTALNDIVNLIKVYAERIDGRYSPESIGMTGGLDSRLVFAAFNAVGADFTCIHGVSGVTYAGDRKIVEQICEKFHKKLEYHDWQQPASFSLKDHEDVFAEVGFYNFIAAGCKAHFEKFKETATQYPYALAGYFGEAVRLRDWAEKKGKTFSLTDYVENYYMNKALKDVYAHYDQLKAYVIDEHRKQLQTLGYKGDTEKIPVDYFERFRWVMARFCDTRSVYTTNLFRYAYPLMGIPYIHEAVLTLPASVIRGGRFQIKLLLALDRGLMTQFDIFSHNRPWRVVGGRKVRKLSKANIADVVAETFPFVKPTLRRLYRNFRNGEGNQRNAMLKDIESLKRIIPSYMDINHYGESLIRIRATLIGCNCLNNISKNENTSNNTIHDV